MPQTCVKNRPERNYQWLWFLSFWPSSCEKSEFGNVLVNQKINSRPTCFPQSLSEVASTVKHWSTVSLLRVYVMYAFKENSTLWFFYWKYQQYVTFKTIFTIYLYLPCCWELDEINTALIHLVKNIRLCTKTSVKTWFHRHRVPDHFTVLSFFTQFFGMD